MAKKKLIIINSKHNCAPEYIIKKTGDVLLCSTRPGPEGGIGKALTVRLPIACENAGRTIAIKDAGSYVHINRIAIERTNNDMIDGGSTIVTLTQPAEFKLFISDGDKTWHQIG